MMLYIKHKIRKRESAYLAINKENPTAGMFLITEYSIKQ